MLNIAMPNAIFHPTAQAATHPAANPMRQERLPFTVRIAKSEEDMAKAVSVRHSAYARHLPDLAQRLTAPEAMDYAPDSVVLLAESKLDGSALGTMRIQTNRLTSLALESSLTLPDWLCGHSLAEATRLGVGLGRMGTMVKTVLFKAFYMYCVQSSIDWMVICARSPLDKQYQSLLFQDVIEGNEFIPLRHTGNIMHRVLAFEIETAETRWHHHQHPLYNFVFSTEHSDIVLSQQDTPVFNSTPTIQTPTQIYLH